MSQGDPPNRLARETSPYLLQHAHNPVDWYPWGEEALSRARQEDRLLLVSIGYSTCHWCHVMERESFEDPGIAALMNEHFVCVKVDREERPDLDDVYMAATLTLNQGQGGWPMTVFVTPDLAPVFAGTYFPPEDRWGRPGFPTLLRRIATAWRERREELVAGADRLIAHLRSRQDAIGHGAIGESELRAALRQLHAEHDPVHGGFGDAPKFPPATALSLLLRLHHRFGSAEALAMVETTLDRMARGGIFDHVAGGFCRYSTDAEWLVPHFEKMLYDNALLAPVYLETLQVSGDPELGQVARLTLDWVLDEMVTDDGGFASATDADSEGEEGRFFVWTPAEIAEILDADDAQLFCAANDITASGNWEGHSIPRRRRPLEELARELGLSLDDARARLETSRGLVLAARRKRVQPLRDDKVLVAWNGMMIHALCEGYRILREPRYLESAERAADFLWTSLRDADGHLLHTYRAGRARLPAYLDDHAYLAEGLLSLFEVSGTGRWLSAAQELVEDVLERFRDSATGAFFTTSERHERLPLRIRESHDGAVPAANAVAAAALARLAAHLDRADYRAAATEAIEAHGEAVRRFPRAFAKALTVVDFLAAPPTELAFVGGGGNDGLDALLAAAAEVHLPHRVQAIARSPEEAAEHPLLAGKQPVDGRAALYICRAGSCQPPLLDQSAVSLALRAASSRA